MMIASRRCSGSALALLLVAVAVSAAPVGAASQPPAEKPADRSAKPAPAPQNPPGAGSPLQAALGGIIAGLKASPGCLGQQVAQTQDGKGVIFAWFKNKKATVDWYRSQTHTRLMEAMQSPTRPPLEGVKDENIPILVIASLTPSPRPDPGQKIPVAQIAIELYTPLPGGFAYGGRFAPETVPAPGLQSAPRSVTAPVPVKPVPVPPAP